MNDGRKLIFQVAFVGTGIVLLVKLFFIQVMNNHYTELANSNSIFQQIDYPIRGLIKDRNGKLLVYNVPEYDLEVVIKEIKNLDSGKFCQLFNITRAELRDRFATLKARKNEYTTVRPLRFFERLSSEEFAKIQDQLDEFPGFFIQARTTRAYTTTSFANGLGYVSEINKEELRKDKSRFYRSGDYVGQSGIEAFYEKQLRGQRGIRFKLRNVKGIEKGSFRGGAYDTLSMPGQDLICSIDLDLQQYGEKLLKGKIGSIVAIQPSTGEILAFVSGPSYNPNLLSGKNYSDYYKLISGDSTKPLFCRPSMAQYRPGSIFKLAQAMTALEEKVITPETRIVCDRTLIGCHGDHSYEDLRGAITKSCNPYFYAVLRLMLNQGKSRNTFKDTRYGLTEWDNYISSFGFGRKLGVDLPNEKEGLVPTPEYYDNAYKRKRWKFSNIYSISIGEGENLVVPLQMANFASTIANRGYYYTPHLVKAVGEELKPLPQFTKRHFTNIDSSYFKIAVDAMQQVVDMGTGNTFAKLPDVYVCGKTGTVQNEPHPAHSVFIAFAPRNHPKIAISVYVENAGLGQGAAAAISSLIIEQYLFGKTRRPWVEDFVLAGDFHEYKK